ncbi:hypothetical protein CEK28_08585 [Xenophilus sp. AP218F]|nr:hypothetical protein CEK28_08585 [Xenophilus sp. AP218F]
MTQRTTGLYPKFTVRRNDGRDQPGGDRAGADYFVLDRTFDPYAIPALLAYADACADEYPQLSADIIQRVFAPQDVKRDEDGWWTHTAFAWIDEGFDVRVWLARHGMEALYQYMTCDIDSDDWKAFELTSSCAHWQPRPPAGDGWFLAAIFETEDGPRAAWVRQKAEE